MASAAASLLLAALLARALVALFPHSGLGASPLHGDFEAQRHWLEVTAHLPAREWYFFDLQYWGLDYPPLTAYHSLLLGKIADRIEPSWVALGDSRGNEDPALRHFMRTTVVVADCTVFFAAAFWAAATMFPAQKNLVRALLLLQPAFIVIDHGHFQYNCVMLGLALLSFCFILRERYIVGSIFFCLALLYKQMALYYALPIFVFLLRQCYDEGIGLFVKIAATVFSTFAIVCAPFLSPELLAQVVHRIFPVKRGLFEDKVASFWCSIDVLIKTRRLFSQETLVILSLVLTLASIVPALVKLWREPTQRNFVLSLGISSLGFFLFSFHVHEKTILLPLLPISLSEDILQVSVFGSLAMFGMQPLLKKDKLLLVYYVALFAWNYVTIPMTRWRRQLLTLYSVLGTVELLDLLPPPARYPDLWVVARMALCTALYLAVLGGLYLKLYKRQLISKRE